MQKTQDPVLKCTCGQPIAIPGKRIADTVECPSCRKPQVVLRSRVEGDVLPASGTGAISDRLPEVQESLKRIRLRHAGAAASGVALYPPAAVFAMGFFGFYLVAILAGQNLIALGQPERGRRLQVLGTALYLLVGACVLAAWVRYAELIPGSPQAKLAALLAIPLVGAIFFARSGAKEIDAAFEAGARPASPLVPALIGFLLVVAQFFVARFVDIYWNQWG